MQMQLCVVVFIINLQKYKLRREGPNNFGICCLDNKVSMFGKFCNIVHKYTPGNELKVYVNARSFHQDTLIRLLVKFKK